jgi:hypothetical protein
MPNFQDFMGAREKVQWSRRMLLLLQKTEFDSQHPNQVAYSDFSNSSFRDSTPSGVCTHKYIHTHTHTHTHTRLEIVKVNFKRDFLKAEVSRVSFAL